MGYKNRLSEGETHACPECDSSRVQKTVSRDEWYCQSCRTSFEEVKTRERRQKRDIRLNGIPKEIREIIENDG